MLNPNFRDILVALNDAKAEYLVVGAYAMAAHGCPRSTGDIDFWVRPTVENAARVWAALSSFGAPMEQLALEDFSTADVVFQIGIAPQRIVVAIEHQRGGRGREVFYSTEVAAEATMILLWFSWRWPIEVTFLDSKQHLGLGEAENRKTKAVRRTVPTGLLMYSLIVLWHECIRKKPAPSLRKWTGKEHASFAEMVAALRTDSLDDFQRKHLSTPGVSRAVHKILKPLKYLIALAA